MMGECDQGDRQDEIINESADKIKQINVHVARIKELEKELNKLRSQTDILDKYNCAEVEGLEQEVKAKDAMIAELEKRLTTQGESIKDLMKDKRIDEDLIYKLEQQREYLSGRVAKLETMPPEKDSDLMARIDIAARERLRQRLARAEAKKEVKKIEKCLRPYGDIRCIARAEAKELLREALPGHKWSDDE